MTFLQPLSIWQAVGTILGSLEGDKGVVPSPFTLPDLDYSSGLG